MIFLLIILILLYLLSLRGRTGHPLLNQLSNWKYAHRGLHGNGVPENSLAAFEAASNGGYGIELDLHLLADGNLAVIHDSSLLRTAGVDVQIGDLKSEELSDYHLDGTDQTIPTFRQVLDLFDGKAPMIVELKSDNNNYAELTRKACEMLDQYKGLYCIESFDPRCIRWLMKNRPDVVRGQLAHNSIHEQLGVPLIARFIMTNLLSNFWNLPDFVAYRFCDRKRLSVRLARGFWKIRGVAWTLKTQHELDTAEKENWIPIFEGFKP